MAKISGIPAVKARLQAIANLKLRKLATGLKKGGLLVQRRSQEIVPIDYGPLKASAFTRVEGEGTKAVQVTVGYTASYAVYVHEDLDKAHGAVFNAKYATQLAHAAMLRKKRLGGTTGTFRHYRGVKQTAKFLEIPFRASLRDIFIIVVSEVSS